MTKDDIHSIKIQSPDKTVYDRIKNNWDRLSKPLDGLGDFETLICRIGAIRNQEYPKLDKKALVCFCADNGIVAEGVSQCGKEVTLLVAKALGQGTSTANVMAERAGVRVIPVDIGIDCDELLPGVTDAKIAHGTKSFTDGPAMTEEQLAKALTCGIRLAESLHKEGTDILAAGEMGIGNTTTSSAILCSLLGIEPEEIAGRGAGLDDTGLSKKRQAIKRGLDKYSYLSELSGFERAFETLRCLGGLDIAGMTGLYIGAARCGLPVVADGLISLAAALLAEGLCPGTKDYITASHNGREKGSSYVLSKLGLKAYINGDMALGEGTGALMLFPLIDMALELYTKGTRFEDAGIKAYERYEK